LNIVATAGPRRYRGPQAQKGVPALRPSLVIVAIVALAAALAACGGAPGTTPPTGGSPAAGAASLGWHDDLTDGADRLDVATTVAPISSLARFVGGDRIRLRGIVPDATNSHTFEPSPSDAKHLAAADLIVANGLHLEGPTVELAESSKRPTTPIRLLGDAAIGPSEWLFDFSFPASAGDPNPHAWMNPRYALRYGELLRDWFTEADPAGRASYAANFERLKVRLDDLDRMIRTAVTTVPEQNRRLLTYHDSWAYWAREYGFTVVGAVQASDFSDPSPQEVARLIDQIRAEKVPAVFGSEVFPSPVLEQIARESGARFVDELRDDEPPGDANAPEHTYLGMMKSDMEIMIASLGGDASAFAPLDVTDGTAVTDPTAAR
jgi:manganese/iron transport system substrate-binding protein